MKKFRRSFPTFLAAALLWGGCAGQGDEEVTTLHVSGGGKLEQVIVEPESGDTFTEEELKKTAEEMTNIIEIMDTIKEIDIKYDALADNKNVYLNDLRKDASEPSMPTQKILQNALNSEDCFVVPKVVE